MDDKELNEYEKSLKNRNMPAYMLEKDKYGIKLYKNKMNDLVMKDDDKNPQYHDKEKSC